MLVPKVRIRSESCYVTVANSITPFIFSMVIDRLKAIRNTCAVMRNMSSDVSWSKQKQSMPLLDKEYNIWYFVDEILNSVT